MKRLLRRGTLALAGVVSLAEKKVLAVPSTAAPAFIHNFCRHRSTGTVDGVSRRAIFPPSSHMVWLRPWVEPVKSELLHWPPHAHAGHRAPCATADPFLQIQDRHGSAGEAEEKEGALTGKLIALTNSKGGVGKSTLAVHLAVWMKDRGLNVSLIDADVQQSSSRWITGMEPEILVSCLHTPDDIIEQAPRLKEASDIVIADGPAGLAEQTRALLLIADEALIPVGPSALDMMAAEQAVRVVKQAQQIRGGLPKALLVLNRVQGRTRLGKEALEAVELLGLPVVGQPIHLRTAFADASGQYSVVWRMGSSAKEAASELFEVFEEVLGNGQTEPGGHTERASAAVSGGGHAKKRIRV
jgi:chromosome partitioning protein